MDGPTAETPERLTYSITETARLLGVSYSTVKRMLAAGSLRFIRVSKHRRVPRDELYRLLDTGTQPDQQQEAQ